MELTAQSDIITYEIWDFFSNPISHFPLLEGKAIWRPPEYPHFGNFSPLSRKAYIAGHKRCAARANARRH